MIDISKLIIFTINISLNGILAISIVCIIRIRNINDKLGMPLLSLFVIIRAFTGANAII